MQNKYEKLFDNYADNYAQTLNKSLRLSGEGIDFFARERVIWTKKKIETIFPERPIKRVLDFGCGTGGTLPIFEKVFNPEKLVGVDVSDESIAVATNNYQSQKISFYCIDNIPTQINFDVAYCNGVFHHIPVSERNIAVKKVHDLLGHQGIWAFWENNFINPGTRYIMHTCEFDKDAVPLSFSESKRMLAEGGFKIVSVSFMFVFPKALKFLRFLEKNLSLLPIGAQYLIIAQKI